MRRPIVPASLVVLVLIVSATAVILSGLSASAAMYPPAAIHKDGTAAGARFATSVALMDLNRDGIADLAVGAPYNGSSQGSVTFFLSEGGVPFATAITVHGWPGSLFGFSLANVGNVSGVGPTLAVGAPFASPNGLAQAGNITFFYPSAAFNGKAGGWINSTHAGEALGYSLAGAGNVNGDAYDDILAGAPFCGAASNGCAYVFFGGKPPRTAYALAYTTASAGAHFGWSVAGGGSVDSNSALDIAVGAPDQSSSTGAVYIIRNLIGTGGSINRTTVVAGSGANARFGSSVGMGDFNADTFADVAVGAPGALGGAGTVSVAYGGAHFNGNIGTTLAGSAGESFGWDIAVGDFHRDGISDLVVGAPGSTLNSTGTGRAYAFYGGNVLASSPNLTLVPSAGDVAMGWTVGVGGDFNGDGGADFVVGDPQFTSGGGVDRGRAYVYAGDIVPTLLNPVILGWICVPGTWNAATRSCAGLSGFTVALDPAGKTFSSTANGSFEFTTVPGTYFLNTSKFPYIDNSSSLTVAFNNAYTVLVFPLTVPKVFGVAKDAVNRTAFAGVTVALYNATNVLVNSTVTPDAVNYSIYVPTPFIPAVGRTLSLTVKMWDGTHYMNSLALSLARNESENASLVLDRFPVVSGTVLDFTLLPIAGAVVQATQGASVIATATTNNRGAYSLVAVNASAGQNLFFNITAARYARFQSDFVVNRNGTYTLNAHLNDDTRAPTSLIAPLLPTYTATPTVAITATASDNYPDNVAQVQLYYRFNGTGAFTLYGSDTSAPYGFSFSSTAASGDGTYEFYTIATDYGGNQQARPSGNMSWTIVDTMPPSSRVAALPTYETSANFTVTAAASDWNPVSQVSLYYRKGTTGSYSLLSTDTTSPYSWYFNTTLLGTGDGLYQFYSLARDAAGNSEAAPASPDTQTTVDATGPALTITYPTSGQVIGTGYVNVTWTASDATSAIQRFDVRLDSGAWLHAGTKLYYNFTGVADGSHTVSVNATDNAGNSKLVTVSFRVSTVRPTVTVTSPADNAILATAAVGIGWTVTNTGAGLAAIEVQLDGGSWTSVGVSSTTYTFAGVVDGSHQLAVRATGLNGAQDTASVSVTVDTTPPTLSIGSPALNAVVATGSVAVTWTASDATSGLAKVELAVDGGTYATVTGTSYVVTGLADGAHTISLRATDNASLERTESVTFVVDTTAPTVSITSPGMDAWLNSSTVTIRFAASDSGSGLKRVVIEVDGGSPIDVTGETSYTFSGLTLGAHASRVTAEDMAGNLKDASVNFNVDTVIPSVEIRAPADGANLTTTTVSVSWSYNDVGGGVVDVQISVDGGAFQDKGLANSSTLQNLAIGRHTVAVRVTDAAGNVKTKTVAFTISQPTAAGGLDPLLVGGGIAAVVLIAVAAAVLLRRRRPKPPPKEPAEVEEELTPPPPGP